MAALSTQGDKDAWPKVFEEEIRNIPSGNYLVRSKVLALHPTLVKGATQFYPNCFIVTVANGAATALPKLYPIPGSYGYDDPGVYFSRSQDPTNYTIPGPPLFTDGGDPA